MLNDILINWIDHIDDFKIFFLQSFNEWRGSSGSPWFSSNEVNIFLILFLSSDVLFEGNGFFTWLRSVISQELCKFLSVIWIFMNSELDVLTELFIEFFEIFCILGNFLEKLQTFLGNVFLNNFKNFVVLKILSGNIQRKILWINNSSNES